MKHLQFDQGNTARLVESKKLFIAPAWAFIRAERSINATADPLGTAVLGAYRGKFLRQVIGTGETSSFGLPASISGNGSPGRNGICLLRWRAVCLLELPWTRSRH